MDGLKINPQPGERERKPMSKIFMSKQLVLIKRDRGGVGLSAT